MRLWTISPVYLDSKGQVALWREGLLAQKVFLGNTKGYKNHPQLKRFRQTPNPLDAIATYLREVSREADKRGFRFDKSQIANRKYGNKIPVTSGQIDYEFTHLLQKLKTRSPDLYFAIKSSRQIKVHPLFRKPRGGVEEWEKPEF